MEMKIVDIDVFNKDIGLDYETLKELYLVFVEEINQEKEAVNNQLTLREFEKLRKSIHNVKGIASNYRAQYVFENAKKIDLKLNNEDYENLSSYISDFSKAIEEAEEEITKYFVQGENS